MSSVRMMGIAEHCDLCCDWIIKAGFLRRALHRRRHSAASVMQDKLLLRLHRTLHQRCNYEIDVVLIQISIWKPVIDRYRWFGGSSHGADGRICSAGAGWEFGHQTRVIFHTWPRNTQNPTPGSHSCVAGGKYEEWSLIIIVMVHLGHIHLWAVVVDIYHLSQSDFGAQTDSSSSMWKSSQVWKALTCLERSSRRQSSEEAPESAAGSCVCGLAVRLHPTPPDLNFSN